MRLRSLAIVMAVAVAGCDDNPPVAPRDLVPPAAPRGLYSVTGDQQVTLHWLSNTEPDVAGYRIYLSPCANGPSCPYDQVTATAGTAVVVPALANGSTRFFAVAAFDHAGNESELSYEDVYDTPRPAGSGVTLGAIDTEPAIAGWDFSIFQRVPFDSPDCDVYLQYSGGVGFLVTAFTDTYIQDAGYAASLDAVDFAPVGGWSPSGAVELIPGHNYIVWTYDYHFAKVRAVGLGGGPPRLQMDWAYQTAIDNPELAAGRPRGDGPRVRRAFRGPA